MTWLWGVKFFVSVQKSEARSQKPEVRSQDSKILSVERTELRTSNFQRPTSNEDPNRIRRWIFKVELGWYEREPEIFVYRRAIFKKGKNLVRFAHNPSSVAVLLRRVDWNTGFKCIEHGARSKELREKNNTMLHAPCSLLLAHNIPHVWQKEHASINHFNFRFSGFRARSIQPDVRFRQMRHNRNKYWDNTRGYWHRWWPWSVLQG